MKLLLILACVAVVLLGGVAFWLFTPDLRRADIEAKYHVTPADYVQVLGITLHVVDSGPRDGPAVIMLHGFGASLQTFDAWSDSLSKNFRVVRYDLPGFGLTGPDPTGDYSDARGIAVLRGLMDRLGIAHASLIGNSMGGKLAWQFAAHDMARVDRLVLVSPDGFASPGFEYGKAPRVPLLLRALPYVLPRPMLRMSIAPAYADAAHLTGPVLSRYSDMMRVPGVRRAILDRTTQTIMHDPVPELHGITAPTLLLWGEKDGMIPFANARDYLAAIPHSTLAALPYAGHVPQEEFPERSLVPVQVFLQAGAKPI